MTDYMIVQCADCGDPANPADIDYVLWQGQDAPDRLSSRLEAHRREFPGHEPFSVSSQMPAWLEGGQR